MCAHCKIIVNIKIKVHAAIHCAHTVCVRKRRPTNLTLDPGVLEWAEEIRKSLRMSSLSTLVEHLIREEFRRWSSEQETHSKPRRQHS